MSFFGFSPVSLELLMQIENDGCFVADVKSSKRKETRALFNMHVSLVEVEWYFKAF